MTGEHIVIADELYDHSVEPTQLTREESIANRIKGIVTELYFYDEGWVKVRQSFKGKNTTEHLIELRFLNPRAETSRRPAKRSLWLALGLGVIAILAALLLPMTALSTYALSAAAIFATLALFALLSHIYRHDVRYRFVTATGRAAVLTLPGSFGCMRRTRASVRMIREAISDARSEDNVGDVAYLRAEMKAHYKLAETGVISQQACADGTRLILSRFNH